MKGPKLGPTILVKSSSQKVL